MKGKGGKELNFNNKQMDKLHMNPTTPTQAILIHLSPCSLELVLLQKIQYKLYTTKY